MSEFIDKILLEAEEYFAGIGEPRVQRTSRTAKMPGGKSEVDLEKAEKMKKYWADRKEKERIEREKKKEVNKDDLTPQEQKKLGIGKDIELGDKHMNVIVKDIGNWTQSKFKKNGANYDITTLQFLNAKDKSQVLYHHVHSNTRKGVKTMKAFDSMLKNLIKKLLPGDKVLIRDVIETYYRTPNASKYRAWIQARPETEAYIIRDGGKKIIKHKVLDYIY